MLTMLYSDADIAVCIKPPRVLSTDEPGGMPELVRQTLGVRDVRTVHRLDRVVGGTMVLALNAQAASELSRQVRAGELDKKYLAIVHGVPPEPEGELRDYLTRDKRRKMTFVVNEPGKDAREAVLRYRVLCTDGTLTRVEVTLLTGRTHQIRVQFASRSMPLVGERKYAAPDGVDALALWSSKIRFTHPTTGERMTFMSSPPVREPWTQI